MTLKTLAAASCLSVAMATPSIAAPVTIDFVLNGATGTFYGLDDADGTSSATSFDFNLCLGSIGLDCYSWTKVESAGLTHSNGFEFRGGKLDHFSFVFNVLPVPDDEGELDLFDLEVFQDSPGGAAGRFSVSSPLFGFIGTSRARPGAVVVTISPDPTVPPVAAVPLPAGGLLFLTAFGGVAALKRRKKRAA